MHNPTPRGTPRSGRTLTVLALSHEPAAPAEGRAEEDSPDRPSLETVFHEQVRRHDGVWHFDDAFPDCFIALFERATDALRCGIAVQVELLREGDAARAGAGAALHTGDFERDDDGVRASPAMARCAALARHATGGQVLLSQATAGIVVDNLPLDVSLLDMGAVSLLDHARQEHPVQVMHPQLPATSTRGETTRRQPEFLPAHLSSFVGRQREIRELSPFVQEAGLLTLVGPGGCGKTRLAIEVVRAASDHGYFSDGAWFVDLARLSRPEAVVDAVATALGAAVDPSRSSTESVIAHMGQKRCVVVLDNCEHVADGAAAFAEEVLRSCPAVSLVATSRQPLAIASERTWPVPSLELPDPGCDGGLAAVAEYDAIRLFVARANQATPGFTLTADNMAPVVEICRRLDGIPLAIELAAARLRMLSPAELSSALGDRFGLLRGGPSRALPRHRSVTASVEWSHDLLEPPAQILLRRLAVFTGGWTLPLAEQVAGVDPLCEADVFDVLAQLVDASMVHVDQRGDTTRYRMLEMIRQFGIERLEEAEEWDLIHDRLLGAMVGFAERAEAELGDDLVTWFELLDQEQSNIAAAMAYGLAAERLEPARRLAAAMPLYWSTRADHLQEGTKWVTSLWEGATDLDPVLELRLAHSLAELAFTSGDYETAFGAAFRVLELATELGDTLYLGRAHDRLGYLWMLPDLSQALTHLELSVPASHQAGDAWTESDALIGLAYIHTFGGRVEAATAALDVVNNMERLPEGNRAMAMVAEGHLAFLASSRDPEPILVGGRQLALSLRDLATAELAAVMVYEVARRKGRLAEALDGLETVAFGLGKASPFTNLGGRMYLAMARADTGDVAGAIEDLELVVAESEASFMTHYMQSGLLGQSWLLAESGEGERAVEKAEQLLTIARAKGYGIHEADGLSAMAAGWLAMGDVEAAEETAHEALRRHAELGSAPMAADDLDTLALIAAEFGNGEHAVRLAAAAQSLRTAAGLRGWSPRAPAIESAVLTGVMEQLGEEATAAARSEGQSMDLEAAAAYAGRGRGPHRRAATGWPSLTPTELQVVKLASKGHTNREIAEQLVMGPATVKTHLSNIFTKLGATNRAQLASMATKRGL